MNTAQLSAFDDQRLSISDSIRLTADSLNLYGALLRHWAVAYSGGKDSSTLVTIVAHLIRSGQVTPPRSLTVFYVDTRMELPPLQDAALSMLATLTPLGIETRVLYPAMDDRFMVYMFGRGVPPPSNTFRWCTSQLKVEPMQRALEQESVAAGHGAYDDHHKYCAADYSEILSQSAKWRNLMALEARLKRQIAAKTKKSLFALSEYSQLDVVTDDRRKLETSLVVRPRKVLMLTGVRIGESAARDARIALSCGRDGAECGQGWYQETLSESICDTLAPILHWRACHVWDWLMGDAAELGFPTRLVADAYGMTDDGTPEATAARTGCVGCNLASRDLALERLIARQKYAYLAPLLRLRPLYAELKKPHNRLRKLDERKSDGSQVSNPGRLGPLTMDARKWGIEQVLQIQLDLAALLGKSGEPANDPSDYSLIDSEELARIQDLIAANTWPDRWDGSEITGDTMTPVDFSRNGGRQTTLIDMFTQEQPS